MSKIQILLAEQENIDDLKVPVRYDKAFFDSVHASDLKRFENAVYDELKKDWVKHTLEREAEFGVGTSDEGYEEPYFENFLTIIDNLVTEEMDRQIVKQAFSLSDKEYTHINNDLTAALSDYWCDYESELCNDWFKNTLPYIHDEDNERKGLC